jgi:hypothetical protein
MSGLCSVDVGRGRMGGNHELRHRVRGSIRDQGVEEACCDTVQYCIWAREAVGIGTGIGRRLVGECGL